MSKERLYAWRAFSAAIFLAFLAPFVAMLEGHGYGYLRAEVWASAGVIALASLALGLLATWIGALGRSVLFALVLMLFVDLQFDWISWWGKRPVVLMAGSLLLCWVLKKELAKVMIVVFGTMVFSALVLPVGRVGTVERELASTSGTEGDLPPLIHVVLDEQIGVEGMPVDLPNGAAAKQRMQTFYAERGFQIFGRAYSQYYETSQSLSNLFNFTASTTFNEFVHNVGGRNTLEENAYFRRMADKGYDIRVYQSTYMDFCSSENAPVSFCMTYPMAGSLNDIQDAPLSVRERMRVIFSTLSNLSFFYGALSKSYRQRVRPAMARRGLSLPSLDWERHRLGPLALPALIERVGADVASSPPGTMFFVHLLIPHFPYVFDRECGIRPVDDWQSYRALDLWPAYNTSESRTRKYALYFDQMDCTHELLDTVFDRLRESGSFDRSTIFVHGDHGSRITVGSPKPATRNTLSAEDYIDGYSTLFAVKLPDVDPVYDLRFESIGRLFSETLDAIEAAPAIAPPEGGQLIMKTGARTPMHERPMVIFDRDRELSH